MLFLGALEVPRGRRLLRRLRLAGVVDHHLSDDEARGALVERVSAFVTHELTMERSLAKLLALLEAKLGENA